MDPHEMLGARLHDATLRLLVTGWTPSGASLRVVLSLLEGPRIVVSVSPLRRLAASRLDEWGPSDFVIESRLVTLGSGEISWIMELQSGDSIEVVGDDVHVELAKAPATEPVTVDDGFRALAEFLRMYQDDEPTGGVLDLASYIRTAAAREQWHAALATASLLSLERRETGGTTGQGL